MAKEMSAKRERRQTEEHDPDEKAAIRKFEELLRAFLMNKNLFLLDKCTKTEVETARVAYARQREEVEYFRILTGEEISEISKRVTAEVNQDTWALRKEEEKARKAGLN